MPVLFYTENAKFKIITNGSDINQTLFCILTHLEELLDIILQKSYE
jgi:hypothetical protein